MRRPRLRSAARGGDGEQRRFPRAPQLCPSTPRPSSQSRWSLQSPRRKPRWRRLLRRRSPTVAEHRKRRRFQYLHPPHRCHRARSYESRRCGCADPEYRRHARRLPLWRKPAVLAVAALVVISGPGWIAVRKREAPTPTTKVRTDASRAATSRSLPGTAASGGRCRRHEHSREPSTAPRRCCSRPRR